MTVLLVGGSVSAQTVNLGLSSEFAANGVGAGLEFGERHRLAFGTGLAFATGSSPGDRWQYELSPGAGVGYRLCGSSGWFTGATVAAHRTWIRSGRVFEEDTWWIATLLDVGYRWLWSGGSDWNTRLGLGVGAAWWEIEDRWWPAAGITFSVGFDL